MLGDSENRLLKVQVYYEVAWGGYKVGRVGATAGWGWHEVVSGLL